MLDCMKEKISLNQFEDSFSALQGKMDGRIAVDDYHASVTTPANELRLGEPLGEGFQLVDIRRSSVAAVAGRVLLLPNRSAFSPAIVTEDAHGTYQITLLDQEYDTKVGFTEGVHFGLSAKAQTQVQGFGGHGSADGFEAGHFSTVLSGAQSEAIANALVASGDKATHAVLENGTVETMSQLELLPLSYKTKRLSEAQAAALPLVWHASLDERGAAVGDYPDAGKLVMGAAVTRLGDRGIDKTRSLVDAAIRGAA